jgi:acetoin utilization protein AcuB
MLVRERMSAPAVTVRPDMDYKKALDLMQSQKLHHVPVVDAAGKLVGIVAERDLLLGAMHYMGSRVDVSEIMHKGVVTATPTMNIAEAAKLMIDKSIGGLPVVEGGAVVGIITETDIFKTFVEMTARG